MHDCRKFQLKGDCIDHIVGGLRLWVYGVCLQGLVWRLRV